MKHSFLKNKKKQQPNNTIWIFPEWTHSMTLTVKRSLLTFYRMYKFLYNESVCSSSSLTDYISFNAQSLEHQGHRETQMTKTKIYCKCRSEFSWLLFSVAVHGAEPKELCCYWTIKSSRTQSVSSIYLYSTDHFIWWLLLLELPKETCSFLCLLKRVNESP